MYRNVFERDAAIIEHLKNQTYSEAIAKHREPANTDPEAAGVTLLFAWMAGDIEVMNKVGPLALSDSLGRLVASSYLCGLPSSQARELFIDTEEEVLAGLNEAARDFDKNKKVWADIAANHTEEN